MKNVVVIGGTRGIGEGVANALAEKGWFVMATGVDDAEVDAFRSGHADSAITAQTLDVRDNTAVTGFFSAMDNLDALVNCAGVLARGAEYENEYETFERVIDINLTGTMRCCLAAHPLLARSGGAIVNTASMLSYFGGPLGSSLFRIEGWSRTAHQVACGHMGRGSASG